MGFSVSGSVVVVLLGLFVALGTFYTTGANTMERLAAAEGELSGRMETVRATDLVVTGLTLSGSSGNCEATLEVNNTGSSVLALNDTTLLVDDAVRTDWRAGASVDGDPDTWLWAPGERLTVTLTGLGSKPAGLSVVSKTGVAVRADTGGLSC